MNKNILKNRKAILSAALVIAATASAFAQGNGIAGINEATSMVSSYFDPGTKLIYAIDFDVTPHQLRHTYITNLLYAGVDPKTVQYVTVNEVNSNQKFDLIRKSILSILQTKNAYDIMPVGKMIRLNSFITQQKPQSCDL